MLDDSSITPEAAVESLGDLRRVNRWFGGVSTTAFLLRRAMSESGLSTASVLEVAAGDGYSITHAAKRLRKENLTVNPHCLDCRALEPNQHCCESATVGDALQLAFPPNSFDFVSCGLFLHHLAPEQVITFINGALQAAKYAVLINDLRRCAMHLALVYAGKPFFRSPISRFDAVASVRQAYTAEELCYLIGQTTAKSLELRNRYLFRMGAIVWK